jgi:hypothetical protein
MYVEALIQLADVIGRLEEKGEFLISEKYHNDTKELIEHLSKMLVSELEFKQKNPGPYSFGFGDLEINIFSPDHTDEQEWASIVRTKNTQKNYRFNSMMGLIKMLIMAVEQENGSNENQTEKSKGKD